MNYNKIIHPETGKVYSIFKGEGKQILKNFIREYKLGGEGEIVAISSLLEKIIVDYSLKFGNTEEEISEEMDKFFRVDDKSVKTPITDLKLDEFDQIESVKITPELHEQIAEYTRSLGHPEEEISNEMSEYFIIKRKRQKIPEVTIETPQCCARVWDRVVDGEKVKGVGGQCPRASTGEMQEFNGQYFFFCKRHGKHFLNNPELAVDPKYPRTEEHSVKTQKKADKLGLKDWKPVLWLGVYCDKDGNLIDRQVAENCVDGAQKLLRWTDIFIPKKNRKNNVKLNKFQK